MGTLGSGEKVAKASAGQVGDARQASVEAARRAGGSAPHLVSRQHATEGPSPRVWNPLEKIPRSAGRGSGQSLVLPPPCPPVRPPTYHASWISVLAYTNRPLYPNGDAAAQGKVPKLLL